MKYQRYDASEPLEGFPDTIEIDEQGTQLKALVLAHNHANGGFLYAEYSDHTWYVYDPDDDCDDDGDHMLFTYYEEA